MAHMNSEVHHIGYLVANAKSKYNGEGRHANKDPAIDHWNMNIYSTLYQIDAYMHKRSVTYCYFAVGLRASM